MNRLDQQPTKLWNKFRCVVCNIAVILVASLLAELIATPALTFADEIRILDKAGLVRAVRVVQKPVRVTVSLADRTDSIQCKAINIDGIAGERSSVSTSSGECVFDALLPGTWQIEVDQKKLWRAKIDEQ